MPVDYSRFDWVKEFKRCEKWLEDALDYAQTALDMSDLLDQDGIVGVNSDIEVDDIEFYEED